MFAWKGSAIYISDKIREKYISEFGLDGDTVYLTSTINRRLFRPINAANPIITYFGNIRMGRNKSLCTIANVLAEINPSYCLQVYSNEEDKKYYSMFDSHSNIIYGGSIPYDDVMEKMRQSDITLIVEGFLPGEIELSRYSLSTKAADALASGVSILVYGSKECGIVEYMELTQAAAVCSDENSLKDKIDLLIGDVNVQRKYYEQAQIMTKLHHNLEVSTSTFENIVNRVIGKKG